MPTPRGRVSVQSDAEARLARLELKQVSSAVQTKDFSARGGQTFVVEPLPTGIKIILPEPASSSRNDECRFLIRNANPVQFVCLDGTINGQSFETVNKVGLRVYTCDGAQGWSTITVATPPLSEVLDAGNTTDGHDIVVTTGDEINFDSGATGITADGALDINATTSVNITVGGQLGVTVDANGDVAIGDPGNEDGGVDIGGVTYQSVCKISDISTANLALLQLHRHSNSLEPLVVSTRSNSTGTSHGAVTINDPLVRWFAAGHDGTRYQFAGWWGFLVDGTPGAGDMPGRFVIATTPDGASVAVERLRINNAGALGFAGANFGTSSQFLKSGGSSTTPAWTTFALTDLPSQAADTFLGRLAGAGTPTAQLLSDIDSTTIIYDATSHTFQKAAMTGAIVSTQNSNATLFGGILDNGSAENNRTNLNFLNSTLVTLTITDDSVNDELEIVANMAAADAKSVLANATNSSAIPAYLAGSVAFQHLRVNSTNTGLEWAVLAVTSPITLTSDNIGFDQTVTLGNNARVAVNKNSGATVGTRRRINFIEGTNITLTIADDAGNEEVDVTIAASGSSGLTLPQVMAAATFRP